jgi:AcrR family transcriptional regulator
VSPRRSSRKETRDALLDAALVEFSTHGYRNTTHADLAAAVGIARTTFYEYFDSTEDLLVRLVEERLPVVVAEIVDSIDRDLPPDVELRELGKRTVEFVAMDHLGLILHTEAPGLSHEAQRRIAAAHSGLMGAFAGVFAAGVEAGIFRDIPVGLAGRLIFQTIMGAGRTVMDAGDPKQQVHETVDYAMDFLVRGLAA